MRLNNPPELIDQASISEDGGVVERLNTSSFLTTDVTLKSRLQQ